MASRLVDIPFGYDHTWLERLVVGLALGRITTRHADFPVGARSRVSSRLVDIPFGYDHTLPEKSFESISKVLP